MRDDWLIWQILDSAFPAGGFAHSAGLEAACQQGWIKTSDDLRDFLLQSLQQTALGTIPFLNAVLAGQDPAELDWHLDTMLSNHVANRASRLQGRTLIATSERVFGGETFAFTKDAIVKTRQPGHLGVMFGVVMKALSIQQERASRMFSFLVVRGIMSAAVRLGAVGPLEAQRLQASLGNDFEQCLRDSHNRTIEEAGQCTPLIELWQLSQDRLYSRLFQS